MRKKKEAEKEIKQETKKETKRTARAAVKKEPKSEAKKAVKSAAKPQVKSAAKRDANQDRRDFVLVREDILPKAIKKTLVAKEMIRRGETRSINEAVKKSDLSRSAYYKYKDYVSPFYEAAKDKVVTFYMELNHKVGVLSEVIKIISSASGNIITINQAIPLRDTAQLTVAVDTGELSMSLEKLVKTLKNTDGVNRFSVIGQE